LSSGGSRLQTKLPGWLKAATLIVAVLGGMLRFHHLDAQSFWWDEVHALSWCAGYTRSEMVSRLRMPPPVKTAEQIMQLQRPRPAAGLRDALRPLVQEALWPPAFFVLAHGWQRHVGDSMRAMRTLPAILSLLAFPAGWWLWREMRAPRPAGWIFLSLLASSPVHLAYSREVKQYALWTVMVLAMSAALLRAQSSGRGRDWLLFAALAITTLYTHLVTGFVLVGLGACVLYLERFRPTLRTKALFASAFAIGLAFAPWLRSLRSADTTLMRLDSWISAEMGVMERVGAWAENLTLIFFDLAAMAPSLEGSSLQECIAVGLAILCAVAFTKLHRTGQSRTLAFVLGLGVPCFLVLATWDLVEGGIRSTVIRFLIPTVLSIQIAVSLLIWSGLAESRSTRARNLWAAGLGLLWTLGLASAWIDARSHDLWSKPQSGQIHAAAAAIADEPDSLVLYSNVSVLSLAWELEPGEHLMHVRDWRAGHRAAAIARFGAVYAFAPSARVVARLSDQDRLEPLFPPDAAARSGKAVLLRLTPTKIERESD
jgi:uncharacterized membrane protein